MAKTLPTKQAIQSAMEVARSSMDGANYLATQFEETIKAAKVWEQSQDMMSAVNDFAEKISLLFTSRSSEAWSGQPVDSSRFKNMQTHIADDVMPQLDELSSTGKKLRMDVAINDEAQFVRGYAVDGEAMDNQSIEVFDASFNAWLAENNLISKGSILYEIDQSGQIKRDAQGNELKVNVAKMKELMDDPQKGFAAYLNRKGIEMSILQQEYPVSPTSSAAKT